MIRWMLFIIEGGLIWIRRTSTGGMWSTVPVAFRQLLSRPKVNQVCQGNLCTYKGNRYNIPWAHYRIWQLQILSIRVHQASAWHRSNKSLPRTFITAFLFSRKQPMASVQLLSVPLEFQVIIWYAGYKNTFDKSCRANGYSFVCSARTLVDGARSMLCQDVLQLGSGQKMSGICL